MCFTARHQTDRDVGNTSSNRTITTTRSMQQNQNMNRTKQINRLRRQQTAESDPPQPPRSSIISSG
jgi:hypothetical protein